MDQEAHLEHPLFLISPPFFQNFKDFAWDKAKRLAAERPELSTLPTRLNESVKSLGLNSEPEKALKKA